MKKSKIIGYLFSIAFILSCGNDDKISNIPDSDINDETSNITDPEISDNDDETPNINDSETATSPNILLIIADDLGKDAINGYMEGNIKPNTPNINAIRNNGITFNNFWTYPTCSPTRSSIITGKYGYRTNVKWANDILNSNETILQKYISNNTNNAYVTAVVGKWHLSGFDGAFNPETLGIDYYAGLVTGATPDYYDWTLTESGISSNSTEYSTTKFTDLAINWINDQSKPWFMWLAYTAPHTPFHRPPTESHSQGSLPPFSSSMNPMSYYMAAIESMDFEIGKLLSSIPQNERENTVIIFIGDNGTPSQVAQSPYSSTNVKGTLYQGGVNSPLFVSGVSVSRNGVDDSLITSSDLFATISEISGVQVNQINDSKSFKPLFTQSSTIRNYQYSELDDGTNDIWVISNGTYKLFEYANGNVEFYDLVNDPYEQNNLLNGILTADQSNIKLDLETELTMIRQ